MWVEVRGSGLAVDVEGDLSAGINRGAWRVLDSAIELAAAENKDRETVYAAIAQQVGSNADQVGRARARQIAANSAPGVWIQNEAGGWARK